MRRAAKVARPQEKESDILRTIMDGLAAKRIWAIRMNSGGMYGVHKGKRWAVKFGRKGMADILALHSWIDTRDVGRFVICPIWIECKTATGKQSPEQAAFQAEVEAEGHRYLLVRSWEDLCSKL